MKSNFTQELERDIRSRVNPQYAHINGTESYERKAMLDEIDRLRMANDSQNFPVWIDSNKITPPLIDGQDYSKNVWGWDGFKIMIVSFFVDQDGYHWANAYGNVFDDAEFDDDYDIKLWQPITIPSHPGF
jgi:hypothetical protein